MPDQLTGTHTAKNFPKHPEVQSAAARCVDFIDLGEAPHTYPGQSTKLKHEVAYLFITKAINPETQRPFELRARFTASLAETANLREFLSKWRGKSITEEQAKAGVPFHKMVGRPALVSVEHKTSKGGRVYANITTIAPLPEEMAESVPSGTGYVRGEFWQKTKEERAAETLKWKSQQLAQSAGVDDFDDVPAPLAQEPDDDLPF